MAKKSAKNNELLKEAKAKVSPKIYDLLIDLINEDKEDLAEVVLKIDYLIDYANTCIRQKDMKEAKETLSKAKARIDLLEKEGKNIEHLQYLYEGILKRCK